MCLFYVGSDGKLKPIAIQLGQDPDDFPIWTPNDGEWAWLLAKIWFRNADFQVHQMTSHLAYTHLLVEPIAIATFMCLPPQHPVYKLLRWHIQFVIAINTIGRKRIVSEVTYIFIRFSPLLYFVCTIFLGGKPFLVCTKISILTQTNLCWRKGK